MERTIEGYFNGTQIIPSDTFGLRAGQKVKIILTVPDEKPAVCCDLSGKPMTADELLNELLKAEKAIGDGYGIDGDEALDALSKEFGI